MSQQTSGNRTASEGGVIAVSGASGMLGQRLLPALERAGYRPRAMVRGGGDGIPWEPMEGRLDPAHMEGLAAVVHLAGENIFGRWTPSKKERIEQSRVRGTRLIAETLAKVENPPPVWISASAIGYYGDRGNEILTEHSGPGEGFLADVCKKWEAATAPAEDAGVRVVNLRIGIVLAEEGGALDQMEGPFKLGVGGKLGSGKQWFSWIHADDLVAVILFALDNAGLRGPLNGVAPNPVTNLELTKTMGQVLNRPTVLPVPSLALDVVFGDMADETLLASTRVAPTALLDAGFTFRHQHLESALRAELT